MKIQEYINHNKNLYPSEDIKQSIYQKVLSNAYRVDKNIKSWYGKFFYTKLTLWLSLVFVLWFLLYGSNIDINYGSDNTKIIKTKSSNIVYADNIAKIISFDGNYNIYHGTWVTQDLDISNWDLVVIDTGSKITFDINSENYGEVYGPARFSIRKEWSNKYFIDLNDSEYFKFYKKEKTNNSIFDKIFGGSEETVISTKKYQIKWNNLNIIIAKKSQDESFIKNNGEDITIIDWSTETKVPTNKIAKLNSEVGIVSDDTWSENQDIINKINNLDVIIVADVDTGAVGNPIDNLEKSKLADNKLENWKIFAKKIIVQKNISDGSWWLNTWFDKIEKYLGQEKLNIMKDSLSYKNIQNTFDSVSIKMVSYDRSYIEDVYAIWEALARIHTKLSLPVNYSPNIYYIKYMSNNLKDHLSNYSDIPNDYIYSLDYISSMMDQLNEKKAWDTLVNNYNIVPEIIQNFKKSSSTWDFSTWIVDNSDTSNKSWNINTWINIKDSIITLKKEKNHNSASQNDSGEINIENPK